jgi:hypothetical protein
VGGDPIKFHDPHGNNRIDPDQKPTGLGYSPGTQTCYSDEDSDVCVDDLPSYGPPDYPPDSTSPSSAPNYVASHWATWIFASNGSRNQQAGYFQTGDPDPQLINGPLIDTVQPSPGNGSGSSLTGAGWMTYPAVNPPLNLGIRETFSNIDAPAGGVPANHPLPAGTGSVLFKFQFNENFHGFLTLWSSLAPNTYAVILEQPWNINATFFVNGQGNSTDGQGVLLPTIQGAVVVDPGQATVHDPVVQATSTGIVLLPPRVQDVTYTNVKR